jgi:hypothetical protein
MRAGSETDRLDGHRFLSSFGRHVDHVMDPQSWPDGQARQMGQFVVMRCCPARLRPPSSGRETGAKRRVRCAYPRHVQKAGGGGRRPLAGMNEIWQRPPIVGGRRRAGQHRITTMALAGSGSVRNVAPINRLENLAGTEGMRGCVCRDAGGPAINSGLPGLASSSAPEPEPASAIVVMRCCPARLRPPSSGRETGAKRRA